MKKLIDYINTNVLVKIMSLKMAAVFARVIAGLLTSKAIAIFIGVEGLALIGNLQNFVSSTQTLSVLGLYNGVVKQISKFKEDALQLSKTISTVFYLGFIATILASFFCYFNASLINEFIFPTYNNYDYVIKIFAIALPFYSLNMFVFSIMNGFSKYKILIIINIIGQVLGVTIALLLIYQRELDGALISVVIAESLVFLITLVGIINRRSLVGLIQVKNISLDTFKQMSPNSIIALFSAVIVPLIALAIRSYIIDNIGYKEAGFWEAITRISKYYSMFIGTLMTLYILPRFSEIVSVKEFRKEVLTLYKAIIPAFSVVLIVIYLSRSYVIDLIFSSDFKPVEDLFLWQLLGDFIRVLSLVIAYQFLAKKMFWHFVITEAFFVLILYLTSVYFIDIYGVKGAVIGHFVSYMLYYAVILMIFSSSLFGVESDSK
ncbi:O-antigen translocase [Postechiella marina]|uniref:O-antigen translocase n=1 Tax=Postechiella marina TaxID=943941 RepID=A0ABP8CE95_9FLAO